MSKTLTLPVWARHNPSTCLINVDLPAPFSPTRPKTDPCGTVSDTSFKAALEPNRRDRFVMVTAAPAASGDPGLIRLSRILLARPLAFVTEREFILHQPANLARREIQC